MSVERRLATFVHVSDVHFGDLDDKTGSATLDAGAARWWRMSRLFDGYLGHSYDALVHLTDLFLRLYEEENARLVVTGDLTACGKPSQFALARRFFEGTIEIDPGNPVGLGVPGTLAHAIPGNHDHWPGSRIIWGSPTEGFRETFPSLPTPPWRIPLGKGRELVLTGIDSDADVRAHFPGTARATARGKFLSQLRTLEPVLGPPRDNEVRVLLCHHSRMHKGFLQGMVKGSRAALDAFIERRDIAVLLTGHVHAPRGDMFELKNRDGAVWEVLEARAGTTLQRDEVPLEWVAAGVSGDERLQPNSLIVHRLVELDDGRIEWRSNYYRRSPVKGFCDEGLLAGTHPLVVWPRPWKPNEG